MPGPGQRAEWAGQVRLWSPGRSRLVPLTEHCDPCLEKSDNLRGWPLKLLFSFSHQKPAPENKFHCFIPRGKIRPWDRTSQPALETRHLPLHGCLSSDSGGEAHTPFLGLSASGTDCLLWWLVLQPHAHTLTHTPPPQHSMPLVTIFGCSFRSERIHQKCKSKQ